ncbi:MAG: hypothetical protein U0835_20995 [Isosphaeraceae bacterium]
MLTGALYDNWWNGGNRTTPQRHNIVGVLTEAASVKMASPVFLDRDQLTGGGRGFRDHKPSVNFVDPWPGGWWRLRDIVDYELICARSILTLAARYREQFQGNLLAMARDSVARGKSSPPYAWVVPAEQRDPGSVARMLQALRDTGVEVHRAKESFRASGREFPAGTWVLPADQPYRAHLKDMMERQDYPTRLTADGKAEPPYDVAGWTLPLMTGVEAVELSVPPRVATVKVDEIEKPAGRVEGPDDALWLKLVNQRNDDIPLAMALASAGIPVQARFGGGPDPDGLPSESLRFPADEKSRERLRELLPKFSSRVVASRKDEAAGQSLRTLEAPRIAVYQPWVPNMDEGWTRLVLETSRIPYTTVHNADIRSGRLAERFNVLLVPAVPARTIRDGYSPGETEPPYVGGLGAEGADALRALVAAGGRVVFLESSCEYAIETFDLPVKSVLRGLSSSTFYSPGSVLRATKSAGGLPLTAASGMPDEFGVYFDQSLAFDVQGSGTVSVKYAASDTLLSGWLLGPEKIRGKAAVYESAPGPGGGGVILIGFRVQHRAQTHGTYRILFNALSRWR